MPDDGQSIPDMEAERAWRLARPPADFPTPDDWRSNADRIRRLDLLIEQARNPQPQPPEPQGISGEMIALALVFTAFALFLAF